jgi:predicted RNase H-like HicB family nuclease
MTTEIIAPATKDLAYYESLPYTVVIRKDEDGDFIARVQELPGCVAHGDSEAGAILNVRAMQRLWIEDALEAGHTIPEPEDEEGLPSGKFLQRVPKKLHRELIRLAERENVSLNTLVTLMLTEATTGRSCVQLFETFLANTPQLLAASIPIHSHAYWGSEPQETQWASIASCAERPGSLIKGINRVKNLARGSEVILLDNQYAYADDQDKDRKQLLRK